MFGLPGNHGGDLGVAFALVIDAVSRLPGQRALRVGLASPGRLSKRVEGAVADDDVAGMLLLRALRRFAGGKSLGQVSRAPCRRALAIRYGIEKFQV